MNVQKTYLVTQVKENEKKLLKALKNREIENLEELLHQDLLFIIPGGQTITKTMDLAAHRSGSMRVDEILANEEVINLVDDTAVVSVLIEMKGKYMDQVVDGKFRYLRVWKLFEEKWKVIAGSCTPIA